MAGAAGEIAAAPHGLSNEVFARAFWCIFYASGVIASLIVYGVLQERIMQISYDGELFKYTIFLVCLNRLGAVVFAICMARIHGENLRNNAPLWKYAAISLSNVGASTCQYEALKYVSFAVQMLGKSFKMMPVMVWGMAISGKRYKLQDWLIALAVTGGVTLFLMTGPTAASTSQGSTSIGLLLLAGFLALDGATSTIQEKLFKEENTTKYNQMMYVNGISALVSFGTLLATGTLLPAFAFIQGHPAFIFDAMIFNVSAITGQWFLISQVKEFGALVFAATMNVRQIASILVSYVHYGHIITSYQILALSGVFFALLYKSVSGLHAEKAAAEKRPLLPSKIQETDDGVASGPADAENLRRKSAA